MDEDSTQYSTIPYLLREWRGLVPLESTMITFHIGAVDPSTLG